MSGKHPIRPLSPHLQVYRPQFTSIMSILHRITGFANAVGSLVLVAWLWSVAYSPDYYTWWAEAFNCWIGKVALIGWSFTFFYHLGNGLRHLNWDTGSGLSLAAARHSGRLVVLFALICTGGLWYHLLNQLGGF